MRLAAFLAALLLALTIASASADVPGLRRDMTYKETRGAVDVLRGDKLVARYVWSDGPRPYIYPIYTPDGAMVTRNFPMKSVAGEPQDHRHHRSMWIGFGDVNGVDFWSESGQFGKIVQNSIDFEPASPGYWSIHTANDWVGPDGKKVCEDERRVSFLSCDYGILISTRLTLRASESELKFGDTKEGFFALRVAPGIQLKQGKGHILTSAGDKDDAAWGKRARWCDYTGEVDGKVCGITIFDAPLNYGHPTYWHVRDYGLFAANPFGAKDFTQGKSESALTIPRYGEVVFVYVVLIHDGKLDAETLDMIADQTVGKGTDVPQELRAKPRVTPRTPPQEPTVPPGEDTGGETGDQPAPEASSS